MTSSKAINLFFDFVQFCSLLVFNYTYIPVIIRKQVNNEEELQENIGYKNTNNNYLMN